MHVIFSRVMIFGYRIAAITPPGLESHRRQAKLTRSRLVLSQILNVRKNKARVKHVIIHHSKLQCLYGNIIPFLSSSFRLDFSLLSGQLVPVVAS